MLADIVGNNHHREEGDQRSEHQAVDENYQPSFAKILQLGAFDFAVDLGERFFAAHGQHGMAESNKNSDDAKGVRKTAVSQPSEGAGAKPEITRIGPWWQGGMAHDDGVGAPRNQHDHHHGDQLHDVQSFFAGFGNPFSVFPPEISGDHDGEAGSDDTGADRSQGAADMHVHQQFADEPSEILARSHTADGAGENVIEH